MSFDTQVYGGYGDEKDTAGTKAISFGAEMVLSDGRSFRYAYAVSEIAAGSLVMQIAATADHGAGTADQCLAATTGAVGGNTMIVTMGGTTAMTKDLYADGYMLMRDDTGEGYVYVVEECSSAAKSSTSTIKLYSSDPLKIAAVSGTTSIGFRKNPYNGCEIWDANAIDGVPLGIAPTLVAASTYFWVQRHGIAPFLAEGTPVVGQGLIAGSAVDGSLKQCVAGSASALAMDSIQLGFCAMVPAASTEFGLVDLTLE